MYLGSNNVLFESLSLSWTWFCFSLSMCGGELGSLCLPLWYQNSAPCYWLLLYLCDSVCVFFSYHWTQLERFTQEVPQMVNSWKISAEISQPYLVIEFVITSDKYQGHRVCIFAQPDHNVVSELAPKHRQSLKNHAMNVFVLGSKQTMAGEMSFGGRSEQRDLR